MYPYVKVQYLDEGLSYHTPSMVNLEFQRANGGGRSFKIFNTVMDHPSLLSVVKEIWCLVSNKVGLDRVCHKLISLKSQIKYLHIREYSNISNRIQLAKKELHIARAIWRMIGVIYSYRTTEMATRNQLIKWLDVKSSILAQVVRISWLKGSDDNTIYFHDAIKHILVKGGLMSLLMVMVFLLEMLKVLR